MRLAICVIEDNGIINMLLAKLLRDVECDVYAYEDPVRALEDVERTRPDLFLIDKGLPTMSGTEVIRLIRESYCRPANAKIIAFSGYPGARDEMIAAGADEYVEKPFGKAAMLGAIERVMGVELQRKKLKKRKRSK
jgi:CheY-like chemotaxis protein